MQRRPSVKSLYSCLTSLAGGLVLLFAISASANSREVILFCRDAVISVNGEVTGYKAPTDLEVEVSVPQQTHEKLIALKVPTFVRPEKNKIEVSEKELKHFETALSQSERSTIFFNLIDRPGLIFGSIADTFYGWRGLLDPNGSHARNIGFGGGSLGVNVPGREKQMSGNEFLFSTLDYVARSPIEQRSIRFPITVAYYNEQQKAEWVKSEVEVPLVEDFYPKPDRPPGNISKWLREELNKTTLIPVSDIRKMKSFFEWIHERPERVQYAKWIFGIARENESPLYKFDKDNRKGLSTYRLFSNSQETSLTSSLSRLGFLKNRFRSSKRKFYETVRGLKLQIGYATGALTDGTTTQTAPAVYEALSTPVDVLLAPELHKIDSSVSLYIERANHYDSLHSLEMTSVMAFSEMKGVVQQAELFSKKAQVLMATMKDQLGGANKEQFRQDLHELKLIYLQVEKIQDDRRSIQRLIDQIESRIEIFKEGLLIAKPGDGRDRAAIFLSRFEKNYNKKKTAQIIMIDQIIETVLEKHQAMLNQVLEVIDSIK